MDGNTRRAENKHKREERKWMSINVSEIQRKIDGKRKEIIKANAITLLIKKCLN